jgi:DNA-binding MarR family transcriptional regulator
LSTLIVKKLKIGEICQFSSLLREKRIRVDRQASGILSTIMLDDQESTAIPQDNLRSLNMYLAKEIDRRFSIFRRGTRYENVRPSDVRVFVLASRGPQTISVMAGVLDVSRQAVHASVQRLVKLGILALEATPNNQRDKTVIVTPRGEHARRTAVEQVKMLEAEFAEAIGKEQLEALRAGLLVLTSATKARNDAAG